MGLAEQDPEALADHLAGYLGGGGPEGHLEWGYSTRTLIAPG